MKVYDTRDIRNLAFVGHGHAGKTSLVSSLLFAAHATDKLGSVAEGSALTDFDPDEIERKVSMALAVAAAGWKDTKLNLIDAPGYANFIGEAAAAMRAADAALLVVHAIDGVAVQTERMWEDAERAGLPVLIVVSALDRERASFADAAARIAKRFGRAALPVALPIGEESRVQGVVCLVSGKAYLSRPGSPDAQVAELPAEMKGDFDEAREKLLEAVAESDDELMNAFLENGTLDDMQFAAGLQKAIAGRKLFPIYATAATACWTPSSSSPPRRPTGRRSR
ncbi:MAG: GTP-binding protein [Acidobacteria bacterium]|nr:GTP-binding protein [Acidobacteriota bacterium]